PAHEQGEDDVQFADVSPARPAARDAPESSGKYFSALAALPGAWSPVAGFRPAVLPEAHGSRSAIRRRQEDRPARGHQRQHAAAESLVVGAGQSGRSPGKNVAGGPGRGL